MATIQDMFKAITSDVKESSFFRNRYILIILGFLLIGVASWGVYFGYTFYRSYKNQEAQKALSVCLDEYSKALYGSHELWPSVEMNCQLGYEHNRNSDLAPYFLAMKVEALLHQGKKEEVQESLDRMMRGISPSSPLYYVFKTQKALIEMDSEDPAIAQDGFAELKKLADMSSNSSQDLALYYLGLYHWSHDRVGHAQEVWQKLVDNFAASAWAQMAASKLQQIA